MFEETSIEFSGDFDSETATLMRAKLFDALALKSNLPDWVLEMEGMSGRLYRRWINNVVSAIPNCRYLEVGSWAGSTACSAMTGNHAQITCIDNWSEFGGPKAQFLDAVEQAGAGARFKFIESDFRQPVYASIDPVEVFVFDGPHSYQDQYDGVVVAQPALKDSYVLIVDDWNWQQVRNGTFDALRNLGSKIEASIQIKTTQDDTHPTGAKMQNSSWHNGYFLGFIRK